MYNDHDEARNLWRVRLLAKRLGLRLQRQGDTDRFMLWDPADRDQVIVGDLLLDDAEDWLARLIP